MILLSPWKYTKKLLILHSESRYSFLEQSVGKRHRKKKNCPKSNLQRIKILKNVIFQEDKRFPNETLQWWICSSGTASFGFSGIRFNFVCRTTLFCRANHPISLRESKAGFVQVASNNGN